MELVRLQLPDVDSERGVLRVHQGKGLKDRVVPIGTRALAWLEKYRGDVRPRLVVSDTELTLYLTRMGEPFSAVSMSLLVRQYVQRALPDKSGSCRYVQQETTINSAARYQRGFAPDSSWLFMVATNLPGGRSNHGRADFQAM